MISNPNSFGIKPIRDQRGMAEGVDRGGDSVISRSYEPFTPLHRASHSLDAPDRLVQRRWERLGNRVVGILVKSVPEGVREDLVSNKQLSMFSMLAALQVMFQQQEDYVVEGIGVSIRSYLGK